MLCCPGSWSLNPKRFDIRSLQNLYICGRKQAVEMTRDALEATAALNRLTWRGLCVEELLSVPSRECLLKARPRTLQ